MNILVFGVQGSGKSVHAEYIANKLGLPYIYTGDLFRNLEKEDSARGKKIKRLMDRGVLIPDEVSIPAFEEYLAKHNTSKGLVLDGFPRTLNQAKSLKSNLDLIFYIDAPSNLIIQRLLKRGRKDDKPAIIKKRINLFKEKTNPVLDYYKEKGVKIVKIDNSPPVEEVQKAINDLLKDK